MEFHSQCKMSVKVEQAALKRHSQKFFCILPFLKLKTLMIVVKRQEPFLWEA